MTAHDRGIVENLGWRRGRETGDEENSLDEEQHLKEERTVGLQKIASTRLNSRRVGAQGTGDSSSTVETKRTKAWSMFIGGYAREAAGAARSSAASGDYGTMVSVDRRTKNEMGNRPFFFFSSFI